MNPIELRHRTNLMAGSCEGFACPPEPNDPMEGG